MDKIVILPGLIAALGVLFYDHKRIYMMIFIPALMLLPGYFRLDMVGLPETAFFSAAAFPVFMAAIFKGGFNNKWSAIDASVIVLITVTVFAEFLSTDFKDAQRLAAELILDYGIPYLLAREIASRVSDRDELLRILVICGVAVAVISLWEFRMGTNLFDSILRSRWPGSVSWENGDFRWGFRRAAGPYGHAIITGMVYSFLIPVSIWQQRTGAWHSIRHGQIFTAFLGLGLLMTMSRGPILGVVVGLILLLAGWSKNRGYAIAILILIAMLGSVAMIDKAVNYTQGDRSKIGYNTTRETAVYRKNMLDNYIPVIKKRPVWGYGRNGIPVIEGQKSIDNQYLLSALSWGITGLGALLLFLAAVAWKLIEYGLARPAGDVEGMLSWALLGGWFTLCLAITFVYLGGQSGTVLFMFAGISRALTAGYGVAAENKSQLSIQPAISNTKYRYAFEKIL